MKWNPNLTPQHIVFEAVELVNEISQAEIEASFVHRDRPESLFVPTGKDEGEALEAARKGQPLQPTSPPPQ